MQQNLKFVAVVALCATFYLLGVWRSQRAWMRAYDPASTYSSSSFSLSASQRGSVTEFRKKFGKARKQVAIVLDKPVYRPGDKLWARGVALDVFDRGFSQNSYEAPQNWRILGPRSQVISSGWVGQLYADCCVGMYWSIPKTLPGGEYMLEVQSTPFTTPAKRTFRVQAHRKSTMILELAPTKDSYGYGDRVEVSVKAQWSRGGAIRGATVKLLASIDGSTIFEDDIKDLQVSRTGASVATLSFTLPADGWADESTGLVTAQVMAPGGAMESVTATLPIQGSLLDVDVYPEGGWLVRGLPSRIYVECALPNGDPADFSGSIVTADGVRLAHVSSVHSGRGVSGVFTVPAKKTPLILEFERPSLIRVPIEDNLIADSGVSIRPSFRASPAGAVMSFFVSSTRDVAQPLRIGLYKKEIEIASRFLNMDKQQPQGYEKEAMLTPALHGGGDGVLRVTVWDAEGKPLAERLVFRHPTHWINIDVKMSVSEGMTAVAPDDMAVAMQDTPPFTAYPGAEVTLVATASFDDGKPASDVVLGFTVTDSRAFTRSHYRNLPPRLATAILLETEVRELLDARAFSFRAEERWRNAPIDDEAEAGGVDYFIDLLLGTQGWRRFAYCDPGPLEFLSSEDEELKMQRQAALGVGSGMWPMPMDGGFAVPEMAWGGEFGVMDDAVEMEEGIAMVAADAPAPPPDAFFARARMWKGADEEGDLKFAAAGSVATAGAAAADGAWVDTSTSAAASDHTAGDFSPEGSDSLSQSGSDEDGAEDFWPGDAWEREQEFIMIEGGDAMAWEAAKEAHDVGEDFDARWEGGKGAVGADMPMPGIAMEPMMWKMGNMKRQGPYYDWEYRRVYAHRAAQKKGAGLNAEAATATAVRRSDMTDTVYFAAGLVTDQFGRLNATFSLSDSVGSFDISVDCVSSDGLLGETSAEISSFKQLSVEASVPPTLMEGDSLTIPVVTTALLPKLLRGSRTSIVVTVTLSPELTFAAKTLEDPPRVGEWNVEGDSVAVIEVAQVGESRRIHLPPITTRTTGGAKLSLTLARDSRVIDETFYEIDILKRGFPVEVHAGGLISHDHEVSVDVSIPENAIDGTISTRVALYPSPVANLRQTLAAFDREPCGCFEQTSSTTYPLALALRYLNRQEESSELEASMRRRLANGIEILRGYESPGGGFEWFGREPGHQALTAYAIFEFMDIAEVVGGQDEAEIIERSRQWLLSQLGEDGKFVSTGAEGLDSFGFSPPGITHAYVLYALLASGSSSDELAAAIERMRGSLEQGKGQEEADSYEIALGALVMLKAGLIDQASKLASLLGFRQSAEGGYVTGAKSSITCSRGHSLNVEVTSLAVLGWLQLPSSEFVPSIQAAISFLAESSKNGKFGSTQGSILALKAIMAYEESNQSSFVPAVASLKLFEQSNSARVFSQDLNMDQSALLSHEALEFDGKSISQRLRSGESYLFRMRLSDSDGGKQADSANKGSGMPWLSTVSWQTLLPQSSPVNQFQFQVDANRESVREGEAAMVTVKAVNQGVEKMDMVVAQIGIPAGMEVRIDRLQELKREGLIASYEVQLDSITIYWDGFRSRQERKVSFDLLATTPGAFTARSSRIFEYYGESETWIPGILLDVVAA